MKFVLTDDRGERLGQPMPDRSAARQAARIHIRAGKRVMIFLADDSGVILSYSSADTAAVSRTKLSA